MYYTLKNNLLAKNVKLCVPNNHVGTTYCAPPPHLPRSKWALDRGDGAPDVKHIKPIKRNLSN